MYELDARNDARNSFYRKAKVNELEDNICIVKLLYSYKTLVAIYTKDKINNLKIYNYLGKFSQTTTRHQKEFFKQEGLNDEQIKELFEEGILEVDENEV